MYKDKKYYDEKFAELLGQFTPSDLEHADEIIKQIEFDYSHGLQRHHDIASGLHSGKNINIISYSLKYEPSYISEYVRLYFEEKGCNVSLDLNKQLIIDKSQNPNDSFEQIIDTEATRDPNEDSSR